MSNYDKENNAQIHVLIPKDNKQALDKMLPKGMLSHIVRQFLRRFIAKMRSPDEGKSPFDAAADETIEKYKKESGYGIKGQSDNSE